MSAETYCLSFGKYLELRFYEAEYVNRPGSKCNHSLHKDYVQIFDCGSIRAAFKWAANYDYDGGDDGYGGGDGGGGDDGGGGGDDGGGGGGGYHETGMMMGD